MPNVYAVGVIQADLSENPRRFIKDQRLWFLYSKFEDAEFYSDTYIKNDPDKYSTILCGIDAVGCQTFIYDGGEKNFKDPGDQVCEWRRKAGSGES